MNIFKNLSWRVAEPAELNDLPEFLSESDLDDINLFKKHLNVRIENINEKTRKPSTTKAKTQKNPGYQLIPTRPDTKLNVLDHKRYIEILKHNRNSHRDQKSIHLKEALACVKRIEPLVAEDRALFLEFTREKWKTSSSSKFIQQEIEKYFTDCWVKRVDVFKEYPQFYSQFRMVPLVLQSDIVCEMKMVATLTERGTIKGLSAFKLEKPTLLKINTQTSYHCNLREAVSFDYEAQRLADLHNAEVVISSSGLKNIIDNSGAFNNTWHIPVKITEDLSKQGAQIVNRKVIYIDKALPKNKMDNVQKNYWVLKRLLKRELGKGHGFNFPEKDFIRTPLQRIEEPAPEILSNDNSSADELVIDCVEQNEPIHLTRSASKKIKMSSSEETESKESVRITRSRVGLDNTFGDSLLSPPKSSSKADDSESHAQNATRTEEIPSKRKFLRGSRKLPRMNVTYRLWTLSPNREKRTGFGKSLKSFKIIIRSKIDLQRKLPNGNIQPFVITPKLEYQLQYGAECLTKGQLCRDYISTYIRPPGAVFQVRVDPENFKVICQDEYNLSKITNDANILYQHKLNTAWSSLYSVLSELMLAPPGNYMLCHNPRNTTFATLMVSSENSQGADLNLETLTKLEDNSEKNYPWIRIDNTVLLPSHLNQNVIPGCFTGKPLSKKAKKKPNNKYSKFKKKM